MNENKPGKADFFPVVINIQKKKKKKEAERKKKQKQKLYNKC